MQDKTLKSSILSVLIYGRLTDSHMIISHRDILIQIVHEKSLKYHKILRDRRA